MSCLVHLTTGFKNQPDSNYVSGNSGGDACRVPEALAPAGGAGRAGRVGGGEEQAAEDECGLRGRGAQDEEEDDFSYFHCTRFSLLGMSHAFLSNVFHLNYSLSSSSFNRFRRCRGTLHREKFKNKMREEK